MCPGNNESGGKRKSGRTRKGSVWLRRAGLKQRMARRAPKTSISKTCITAWQTTGQETCHCGGGTQFARDGLLHDTRGRDYEDLGANYFDERNKEMVKRQAVKRWKSWASKWS